MTRKDYKLIAEVINLELRISKRLMDENSRPAVIVATEQIAQSLAKVLEQDNQQFKRNKFLAACGVI